MISKELILSKTRYGLKIYSHILRLYYPGETVMHIVGRDCGLCRNPFNNGKNTLHIWIEKATPKNAFSAEKLCRREQNSNEFEVMPSAADFAQSEFARHKDTQNAIAAGDAFGFAELHYKQQGDEFLQILNKEMFLHIGEQH
jgi:hypothetical protein